MRENRLHGSEGGVAKAIPTPITDAATGCRLDARRAITLHQPQNAKARPKTLLGMLLGLHDGFAQRDRCQTNLGRIAQRCSASTPRRT